MKRSAPLKRTKPLAPGGIGLTRSEFKRKAPVARVEAALTRRATPMRARSKTNARPRAGGREDKLCRDQPCYLRIPGICTNDRVVPCHSNQMVHGKGRGIKAHDYFTVPGCWACHAEIDQGARFDRQTKFGIWDRAYEAWRPVRDAMLVAQGKPVPASTILPQDG